MNKKLMLGVIVGLILGQTTQAIDPIKISAMLVGGGLAFKVGHDYWKMGTQTPQTREALCKKLRGRKSTWYNEILRGQNQNDQYPTPIEYVPVKGFVNAQTGEAVTAYLPTKTMPYCPAAGWGKVNKFFKRVGETLKGPAILLTWGAAIITMAKYLSGDNAGCSAHCNDFQAFSTAWDAYLSVIDKDDVAKKHATTKYALLSPEQQRGAHRILLHTGGISAAQNILPALPAVPAPSRLGAFVQSAQNILQPIAAVHGTAQGLFK